MRSNSADAVAQLYTEDCRIADPLMEVTGRGGLRDACAEFVAAFRIESIKINEVIEQLAQLAVRWSWSVSHQGEYLGVPASGRRFDTWNVMFLEVRDGLVCRDLSIWDAGELRRLERVATDGAVVGA
jgi:C-1 hydroxylase